MLERTNNSEILESTASKPPDLSKDVRPQQLISSLFMSWLVVAGAESGGEEVVGEGGASFFCLLMPRGLDSKDGCLAG